MSKLRLDVCGLRRAALALSPLAMEESAVDDLAVRVGGAAVPVEPSRASGRPHRRVLRHGHAGDQLAGEGARARPDDGHAVGRAAGREVEPFLPRDRDCLSPRRAEDTDISATPPIMRPCGRGSCGSGTTRCRSRRCAHGR